MSVGVVTIANTPSSRMVSPMTTKVYGRRSARRTIHMTWAFSLFCGCTWAPARFLTGRTSVEMRTARAGSVRGMTDGNQAKCPKAADSAGATLHIVRDRAGGRMYGDGAGPDTIHGAAGHA